MSGVANPGANFVGRRLHVQQAGNLIEIESVQLLGPDFNFSQDNGLGGLGISWNNPTSEPGVPVGIQLVVSVDDVEMLNTLVLPPAHVYTATLGIGVYSGTLTNKGNGTIYLDSVPTEFGGFVTNH